MLSTPQGLPPVHRIVITARESSKLSTRAFALHFFQGGWSFELPKVANKVDTALNHGAAAFGFLVVDAVVATALCASDSGSVANLGFRVFGHGRLNALATLNLHSSVRLMVLQSNKPCAILAQFLDGGLLKPHRERIRVSSHALAPLWPNAPEESGLRGAHRAWPPLNKNTNGLK
jgi:hypothetical protein